MGNPPNGLYVKVFGNEVVHTVDGKVITSGLRVFTNNLDRGVVTLDRANYEWHSVEERYVLWFDVLVDTDYTGREVNPPRRVLQSDDRVATTFNGRAA